jgi:hypothetical protein
MARVGARRREISDREGQVGVGARTMKSDGRGLPRRRLAGRGGWLAAEVGWRRRLAGGGAWPAGDGPQRTSGGAGGWGLFFSFLFFYFLLSELTSGPHQWHVHVSIYIIFFALIGGSHP